MKLSVKTVSVLIAAYNAEETIALAVKSALAQTAHLHEVIVVDDASTDRTLEILEAIDDPRLKVLRQPTRQGPGVARNRAIEASTGQWMAILDADDAFQPQRLEILHTTFPSADKHAILADHWMYCRSRGAALVPWKKGEHLPAVLDLSRFLAHEHFLIKPLLPASIRKMDIRYPDYFCWEDSVFMSRLLARGFRLFIHPEPMYLYRLRQGSLSHDLSWHFNMETVFTTLLDELEPVLDEQSRKALLAYIHKAHLSLHYLPVLQALRTKRYGQALRLLLQDQARRQEFLRRLWPSVLKNLSVLRFPGTTGR